MRRVTSYYLDNRKIDKKDIPKNAVKVKVVKNTLKWAGISYLSLEKYYEIKL